ncbi:Major facilitator superfamily domain, general substrate transporter [Metarhizium guizhouense ARSEF 977]|uniref:Major facilitator superfamily domain, general substrate transporter n=1 Tax=Metarhizium guizhouense (strain ARSEF 977) TaxID=1276136 RepID=A0A0B4GAI2_METGA|nr:Major facilitator superfamily domain, general substrate transporter [Metarhizium guizhouense ARSEF 977]
MSSPATRQVTHVYPIAHVEHKDGDQPTHDNADSEHAGSVLLLAADRNEPLGLRNIHARTSHSSIPAGFPVDPGRHSIRRQAQPEKKRTQDGTIILDPQPDESANDPLNWPGWRRDSALLSLGFYCMIGGGIGSFMAPGLTDIAQDYHVNVETVSLVVGLYMAGLGVGSVVASPTAILFGKRPVYLASAVVFIGTCIWAGLSPSFPSLVVARIVQGMSLSPIECLPSATIAEIFFLHERAYRIGIYTLLLLGGKNLIPLVSAAIIGRFGWRWIFFIIAIVACFSFMFLVLFVPETFWDRTPTRGPTKRPSFFRRFSSRRSIPPPEPPVSIIPRTIQHTGQENAATALAVGQGKEEDGKQSETPIGPVGGTTTTMTPDEIQPVVNQPGEHGSQSGPVKNVDTSKVDCVKSSNIDSERGQVSTSVALATQAYTHRLRQEPAESFAQQLRPYHGRLNKDKWLKVMVRPFILFAYPSVLWSAAVYSCSIGWLMVMCEIMAIIYRDPTSYNFTSLQTGLVYISPFIGGILGTAVAGRVSDMVVRAMSSRNGGLYEPEFRLVMAIPITLAICTGLVGFGWSAEEKDHWIVPTIFFGVLSFGCSLGSTTSITFCVDSYRQYAGEALVTLNFAKNIFHGLVFGLFVSHWMVDEGPKKVFMWLGIIQLVLQITTIPMFIFGKRARLWTVRKNFMEKF